MEILDKTKVLERLCKKTERYIMYISFSEDEEWNEIINAAPYLKGQDQILVDCEAWLLFYGEEEMYSYYDQTVGSDGPTKLNNYTGSASIYAMTCNPNGEIETENT